MDLEKDHGMDLEDFGMGYLDDNKTSWIYANAMLTATTTTATTTITTTITSSCGDIT